VLHPPPIQLLALLGRQLELALTFSLIEAFPQRHRQLGAYQADNWLRCWFRGIDASAVPITQIKRPKDWQDFVVKTLTEVRRTLRRGGHVAFEVGEVRGGALRLEELVIPAGREARLHPIVVVYNSQRFTKTANCWGVTNNSKGTNTNRIVLFRRDD